MTHLPPLHPAVRAYAARHGIPPEAFRSDGRMALTFDEAYRVQVRPAAQGQLALTARLLDLEGWPAPAVDELLLKVCALGCGLARLHAPGLTLDGSTRALQLQQLLPATTSVETLERELGDFVNVLAFWHRICTEEAARAQAGLGQR